ncbi:alpha/beta hydrolase [[Clostridium] colinum]|uniref:alpha/beta hydrolase n=1 Tax=[Clostridium] colinum TaxID=36835 RepID=UPI002024C0C6|nr:alpha/beta hydrolase [[Clostridium] colinum]
MKKIKHKGLIYFLCIAIVLFFREMYFAVAYLYNICLSRTNKVAMMKLLDIKKETKIVLDDFEEEKDKIEKWLQNTLVKGLKIKSFKKTTLFAEWFINSGNKWVIVLHGYGANGRLMYYVARRFHKKGYNVLVPDLRGHGISGGNYVGMGWHDRLDVINWIKEIIKIDKNAKIVLYGVSMGASSILMASGEKLPKNVKCIISDCAFTSAYDIFKHQLKNSKKVPVLPFMYIINILCKIKNGYSLKKASAINQIKKNKLPIFFIHGAIDNFVPTHMVFDLYKSANCEKELMIVNNAGHTVSEMVERKIYWRRVSLFLDKYC